MGRTAGATNRTPREIETASKNLAKEAKLKRRIAAQKQQLEAKKAKKASKK